MFLESAALAKEYYDALLRQEPFARFFWGGTVFPLGPVSRILGELALLRGDHERAREHFDTAVAGVPRDAGGAVPGARRAGALPRRRHDDDAGGEPTAQKAETSTSVTLTREGDVWLVSASMTAPFRVKHAKGMEYLDDLLRSPGREVDVLVLAGADEAPEDAGAVLDDRAEQAGGARGPGRSARRSGAAGRSRTREPRARGARGGGGAARVRGGAGRTRSKGGVERAGVRARVNVQRRLKDAIRRIAEHEAALGRYLDATVRTGTYCVYRPVSESYSTCDSRQLPGCSVGREPRWNDAPSGGTPIPRTPKGVCAAETPSPSRSQIAFASGALGGERRHRTPRPRSRARKRAS